MKKQVRENEMKTLDELMANVRDCDAAAKSTAYVNDDWCFKEGHKAACDRLIPALREAIKQFEKLSCECSDQTVDCPKHYPLGKLRAILESKETK